MRQRFCESVGEWERERERKKVGERDRVGEREEVSEGGREEGGGKGREGGREGGRDGGSTKKSTLYALNNVDNFGRPLIRGWKKRHKIAVGEGITYCEMNTIN